MACDWQSETGNKNRRYLIWLNLNRLFPRVSDEDIFKKIDPGPHPDIAALIIYNPAVLACSLQF
jgi:hypothetical protein